MEPQMISGTEHLRKEEKTRVLQKISWAGVQQEQASPAESKYTCFCTS